MESIIYSSDPWFPSSENAFTLFIAITHACNQKCLHCFAAEEGVSLTTLKDEEWLMLIDQVTELENPRLFFTGGEPLMHPSLIRIATYAHNKGIPIILGTNATLITPQIAQELFKSGISEARVSLDGSCATSHDALRGMGSFEKTCNGILLLVKVGISVSIRTTVTKLNYKEFDKIQDLVADLGILDWEIKNIIPAGRALHYPGLLTTLDERKLALQTVLNIYNTKKYPRMNIKLMEGTVYRDTVVPEGVKIASCPAGSRMMVVNPNGNVIPCGYLSSLVLGNITEKSFKEIKESWGKAATFSPPVECADCKHKILCKGGCPAYNFCYEGINNE